MMPAGIGRVHELPGSTMRSPTRPSNGEVM